MAIGTGHLFRCLTLANAMKRKGASISFICRGFPADLDAVLEKNGFDIHRLSSTDPAADAAETMAVFRRVGKPHWLVADHYSLDRTWEVRLRPFAERIMVIDDLANRPHDCDLLLDQNDLAPQSRRYAGLVVNGCKLLLGPRYALLRPEFLEAWRWSRNRDGNVRRILLSFGGSDPTNETEKALEAIRILGRPDIIVDVVVGEANEKLDRIRRLCSEAGNFVFYRQANNMAELMSKADLAIGAPGTSTWERCFLGLPAVTVVVAENQLSVAGPVSTAGAIVNMGWHSKVGVRDIVGTIRRLLDAPSLLKEMARKGRMLMGGSSYEGVDGVARVMIGDRRVAT
jgi:UDP-2,4-diacetamido-2,4,6-trideoxy-beta-L-altropyranose hydrolase